MTAPPRRRSTAVGGLAGLLVLGALARIAGLWGPGHTGDIQAFVMWAEGAAQHGLGAYYDAGGDANYPPMLYLLWPLGVALDGRDLEFAIRLLSVPFDLALGALLYVAVRRVATRREGLLAAAFYLFNPAVLMSGPIWGQVDGMGALPMVGAIVAVSRGRVALAAVLAVLAGLLKPQFGIAGLVLAGLALFWLRRPDGGRGVSRDGAVRALLLAGSAAVTFLVVLLPLDLDPARYLAIIGATFERYPFISQFAFNPWAVLFGFNDADGEWLRVGTGLALAGIVASLWLLRRRRDLVGLLGVGVLIGLVVYFLPTRVHERYLFGAVAFLAPLAALRPGLRAPFVVLSVAFFLTLAYVVATSPYRILPGEQMREYPELVLSAMSAAMSAIGAWTAWAVFGLFGRTEWLAPDEARSGIGGDAVSATIAGSG